MSESRYIEGILNVCVCVPSNGFWHSDFGRNLVSAAANFMAWTPPKEMGYRGKIFQILTADSSMLVRNRHDLIKSAMKAGASHILFLDSDMKFPGDIIERWVVLDKPIVAANATQRRVPIQPVAHDFDGVVIDSSKRSGLEAVRQVGCAVMMIQRNFFAQVHPPYFMMDWTPDCQSYSGEDVYFCAVAQEAGFDILVDHDMSVEIEHIGFYSFGYKDLGVHSLSAKDIRDKTSFDSPRLSELFMRNSDEVIAFGTDKETTHKYGKIYDELFPTSIRTTRILELGYYGGGGAVSFAEFFTDAEIIGLDLTRGHVNLEHPRVTYYEGDVTEPHKDIKGKFDLIVDDASHDKGEAVGAFEVWFPFLCNGGIYIIEDVADDWLVEHFEGLEKAQKIQMTVYDNIKQTGRFDERVLVLRNPQ